MAAFDDWIDFDPIEYVTRNYGRVLPEDRIILETVIASLKNIPSKGVRRVADIGAGPNFYPAMLLASLLEEGGTIDLIELSQPNRVFMNTLLDDSDGIYHNKNKLGKSQSIGTRELWQKFDSLIAEMGGQARFQQAFIKAQQAAKSVAGDIYTLPESAYDFVSSYFVAESITTSKAECTRALNSLIKAVRPGGGFMVALMTGSKGYPAGEATHFPAVDLSLEEVLNIFGTIPGIESRVTPAEDMHDKARKDYQGMAVVVGRRSSVLGRSVAGMSRTTADR